MLSSTDNDHDDRSSTFCSAPSKPSLDVSERSFSSTMPTRTSAKRTIEEVAAAEESGDDDYDDKAPGPSKSRSQRSRHRSKPVRKRQRRTYGSGDEVDEDEDDSLLSESSSESEKEEEPVEMNEHGRPLRKAAKARITYQESDPDDDDDFGEQISESDKEETKPPPKSKKDAQTLIVRLKTRTTPAAPARSLRKRSGSHSSKPPPTPIESTARRTRRSSRLSHDDEETLVGLSNSGKHAEVVRRGSREPEVPVRQTRGGKGLKYPSKSTIEEASQEDSNKPDPEEVLEIKASQHEIMGSDPQAQGEAEGDMPRITSDTRDAAEESSDEEAMGENSRFVPESQELGEDGEKQDDDDDEPISRGRTTRASKRKAQSPVKKMAGSSSNLRSRNLRSEAKKRPSRSSQRKVDEESSDFEPDGEHDKEDEMSASEQSERSPQKAQDDYESSNSRRSRRLQHSKRSVPRQSSTSDEEDNLAEELAELKSAGRKRKPRQHDIVYEPRRTRGPRGNVDYRLLRPELIVTNDDAEEDPAPTPSRRRNGAGGGGGWQRSLFSTYGPFGGAGGPAPILGGPGGIAAAGGADSDSSDEEVMQRPKPIGGTVGMTPTSAFGPGFGMLPAAQALNADAAQGVTGTPANLGRVKDKQALADADPLGVDQHVTFEGVGGLQGHIDQLKEMVALPLLYPEIFMRFKLTPPRGVLFHGPPGTGKTLLARALASSVSSQGKKVTFYMRKGADALSKWVGEAEKQLRMLFEEARRTQPSIIFFDEIDGTIIPNASRLLKLTKNRPCASTVQQAGADPCFYRIDTACSYGRHGWSGPSSRDWSHKQARLSRPSIAQAWPL